jgi:cytochrome c peroxidase
MRSSSLSAALSGSLLCLGVVNAGPAAAQPVPPSSTAFYARSFSKPPKVPEMTELGRALFVDPSLSASGKLSCASCHDPRYAYGPPNARSVQLGGSNRKHPGTRAVPALRYTQDVPPFSEHHFDEAADESQDQGPTGGRTWDGRANSAHAQAQLPLLSPLEMANASSEDVVAKVERSASAARFRETFGEAVFANRELAWKGILMALEVFQQSPKDFYPYTSKYDAWLRRQGPLSEQELRGLRLFSDPRKGNCASCHPAQIRKGSFPQFTDYGLIALGVPRNRALAANADPAYFDLGLCGPLRSDLADKKAYCGRFRTPTLRNVALRKSFFHNGVFHSLQEVLRFYAQRDTQPQRWYARTRDGAVHKFDDLPLAYQANIEREPPFDRKLGDAPVLTEAEIGDVIAFLKTLTDPDLLGSNTRKR